MYIQNQLKESVTRLSTELGLRMGELTILQETQEAINNSVSDLLCDYIPMRVVHATASCKSIKSKPIIKHHRV